MYIYFLVKLNKIMKSFPSSAFFRGGGQAPCPRAARGGCHGPALVAGVERPETCGEGQGEKEEDGGCH